MWQKLYVPPPQSCTFRGVPSSCDWAGVIKTLKVSPSTIRLLPVCSFAVITNLIDCPHSVLYITPSSPFSIVTVDKNAKVKEMWSATAPNVSISRLSRLSCLNFNPSFIHGSSWHLVEVKSCNRLEKCFCMFNISTSLPFSSAFLVKSKLLCRLARAVSNFSCWISRDLSFEFFNSPISVTNWWQRVLREAVRSVKHSTTSCTVSSA